jgi:hypothetical protein
VNIRFLVRSLLQRCGFQKQESTIVAGDNRLSVLKVHHALIQSMLILLLRYSCDAVRLSKRRVACASSPLSASFSAIFHEILLALPASITYLCSASFESSGNCVVKITSAEASELRFLNSVMN